MSLSGTIPARTVKRHIYAPAHRAIVGAGPGFMPETEAEIRLLIDARVTPSRHNPTIAASHGRILIRSIDYRSLLELVLRSTCATDIGMVVGAGQAQNEKELAEVLSAVDWRLFLGGAQTSVRVRSESHASRLYHTELIKETMTEILRAQAGAEPGEAEEANHVVTVRLRHDRVQVVISLCGSQLWRRGYRASFSAVAPLREDLAQASVQRSLRFAGAPAPSANAAAPPVDAVLVPFCGSGTLAFESLIALADIPPFLFRDGRASPESDGYAFERFAFGTPPSVGWLKRLLRERTQERLARMRTLHVRMIDSYAPACESAQANWRHFAGSLPLSSATDADRAETDAAPGLPFEVEILHEDALVHDWAGYLGPEVRSLFIPLNPPYGRRIRASETASLYQRIGRRLERLLATPPGAHRLSVAGFVLCPDESSWHAFMRAAPSAQFATSHFMQGGLDIRLCAFRA